MMKKAVLLAFAGDQSSLLHVLTNAVDMYERGHQVKVIIDGPATSLIPEMACEESPLYRSFEKVREMKLLEGVCRNCSTRMGTIDAVKELKLKILDDMSGHPAMGRYRDEGFEVITL